jgi:hypothetical protein
LYARDGRWNLELVPTTLAMMNPWGRYQWRFRFAKYGFRYYEKGKNQNETREKVFAGRIEQQIR